MQRNSWQVRRNATSPDRGFTLVELLIVIAIIGVLIALLMPAVNSARESGRRAQCMNNVRQLALANLAHESAQKFLPGGGWGWGWVGDADRGAGMRQPGGWIYNILPYVDQNDLHDMGKGMGVGAPTDQKYIQHGKRVNTPTAITICPSRRRLQVFTWWTHGNGNFQWPSPPAVARSDYGSNGGDKIIEPGTMGLWSPDCMNSDCGPDKIPADATLVSVKAKAEAIGATGVDYPMSTLPLAAIKDGLTYTYLLGEKFIGPDMYVNGQSAGDNENQYIGFNADIGRWTAGPPSQDRSGNDSSPDPDPAKTLSNAFGSAHPAGFHMAFCDGSVRKMNYDLDPAVHKQLGNRADGQPTQLQALEAGK